MEVCLDFLPGAGLVEAFREAAARLEVAGLAIHQPFGQPVGLRRNVLLVALSSLPSPRFW